jgi:hypothetical protein
MKQSNSLLREGFQVNENPFTLPEDSINLDPKAKRAVTICNLFVNHSLPIADIASLLDEDRSTVLLSLIEAGIINDRRHKEGSAPSGTERRVFRAAT